MHVFALVLVNSFLVSLFTYNNTLSISNGNDTFIFTAVVVFVVGVVVFIFKEN